MKNEASLTAIVDHKKFVTLIWLVLMNEYIEKMYELLELTFVEKKFPHSFLLITKYRCKLIDYANRYSLLK